MLRLLMVGAAMVFALTGCRVSSTSTPQTTSAKANTTVVPHAADDVPGAAGNVTANADAPPMKARPVGGKKLAPPTAVHVATGSESTDERTAQPRIATPFPGVRVWVNGRRVELDGHACLDVGWLELIACSPYTKEHETLVVLAQKPSDIHAALLLAGFEAGTPGRWTYENETFSMIPPTGSKLRVDVRYTEPDGTEVTESICNWIHDHLGRFRFSCANWTFGGSQFEANPPSVGGEHYVADMTGSIIGLDTFGDEVIGYSQVIAPDSAVQEPEWEVDVDAVPPLGTPVTVILRPFDDADS